jgi:hypothetical protein
VRRLRRYELRSEWDVRDGANGYRRENRSRGLIWNRGGGRSRRLIRREDTCWSNRDVFSLNELNRRRCFATRNRKEIKKVLKLRTEAKVVALLDLTRE